MCPGHEGNSVVHYLRMTASPLAPPPQPTSFTPPYGSAVNVRINNTYLTQEVIKQLLMKYKVRVWVGHGCVKGVSCSVRVCVCTCVRVHGCVCV